jgi:hypothetical protein
MTHLLKRDLEWWRTMPDQHNGRLIYIPIETAYHTDYISYGWGVVLNDIPTFHARVLVRRRPATTYNMEGATSRTPRNRVFPATSTGAQRLTTRG